MSPREIVTTIVDLERLLAAEKLRHDAETARLRNLIAGVRAKCPHALTTFYPDPSGGSDSWRECDLCGADADAKKEVTP